MQANELEIISNRVLSTLDIEAYGCYGPLQTLGIRMSKQRTKNNGNKGRKTWNYRISGYKNSKPMHKESAGGIHAHRD